MTSLGLATKSITILTEVLNAHLRLIKTDKSFFVRVDGKPKITNRGTIKIGYGTLIRSTIAQVEIATTEMAKLEIGKNVRINYGCSIGCTKRIKIGSYTRIGPYCTIIDSNFHDKYNRKIKPQGEAVEIGENVLIGTKSIILKNVSIGDGTIVGAGSVVSKSLPSYVVAAGNPARIIKHLNPELFTKTNQNDYSLSARLKRIQKIS